MKLFFDNIPIELEINNNTAVRITSHRKLAQFIPSIEFEITGAIWGSIICGCPNLPPEQQEVFQEAMNVLVGNTVSDMEENSSYFINMGPPRKFVGDFVPKNHQLQFIFRLNENEYEGYLQFELAKEEQFIPLQRNFGDLDYA